MEIETKSELKSKAKRIHEFFHQITPIYKCEKDNVSVIVNKIPEKAGIMIFFENSEDFFGMNRITYIGETKNLKERVSAHLRSHTELTKRINEFLKLIESEKLLYPRNANKYILENMTFVVVKIPDEKLRHELKNNLLYTLSEYNASWLGNSSISDENPIAKYRLWASEYRKTGRVLSDLEINGLDKLIRGEI